MTKAVGVGKERRGGSLADLSPGERSCKRVREEGFRNGVGGDEATNQPWAQCGWQSHSEL